MVQRLDPSARGHSAPTHRPSAIRTDRPFFLLMAAVALSGWSADPTAADPAQTVQAKGCVTCHGMDGMGTSAMFPNLAGQSELYLEQQLKAFRSGERQSPQMNIVVKNLSDQEISEMAAYYAGLNPCGS
jgi:cytochrome c553